MLLFDDQKTIPRQLEQATIVITKVNYLKITTNSRPSGLVSAYHYSTIITPRITIYLSIEVAGNEERTITSILHMRPDISDKSNRNPNQSNYEPRTIRLT